MSPRLGLRVAGGVLAGGAYLLLCHWLMTSARPSAWNVVVVLGPMLALLALGAWRAQRHGLAAAAALGLVVLIGQGLGGHPIAPQRLYVAEHVAFNLALAAMFGATLRSGAEPLISALARRVHREFSAEMARYTRRCTLAWSLYFIGVASLSVAIYAVASFEAWATYANFIAPLTVPLMFGAEHALRYCLHPEFERASAADAVRSYRQWCAEARTVRRPAA